MPVWKVLLTDGLEEKGQAILRAHAQVDDRKDITAEELLQVIGEYDAIIVRGRTKITPAVLASAKKLKVAGRAGVGVDNIDLNAAKEAGVTVVNSPLATTVAVAELTMGLMLSLIRDIPRADAGLKEGKWLKKELRGAELFQKTLGIIGFGRIGAALSQRAKAFEMDVIAYDPHLSEVEIRNRGGVPVSFDELLKRSDYISMHIPLTAETKNLLDAGVFGKMKKGARIICAARGGVIDETALLAALESGQVAGAALDVFATEPPGQSPLTSHPKVVGTPHIGAELKEEPLRWRVA
jgi:D-3-phosphoglycerate dehydrogenase